MFLLPSSVTRTWMAFPFQEGQWEGTPSVPSLTTSSVLNAQLRLLFDFSSEKVKALVKDSERRIQLNWQAFNNPPSSRLFKAFHLNFTVTALALLVFHWLAYYLTKLHNYNDIQPAQTGLRASTPLALGNRKIKGTKAQVFLEISPPETQWSMPRWSVSFRYTQRMCLWESAQCPGDGEQLCVRLWRSTLHLVYFFFFIKRLPFSCLFKGTLYIFRIWVLSPCTDHKCKIHAKYEWNPSYTSATE